VKKFLAKYRTFRTPEQKREHLRQQILCSLSGLLLGLSFPPVPLYFLVFIALVPYLYVISRRETLADISRASYLMGFVFTITTLYWVGSWAEDADTFLLIAGATLMFFNPLLFLIPSTLFYLARKRISINNSLLIFPLFWVFYEYIYSVTEFRFPWLTLGNSLSYYTTFIQVSDIIGAYGLSLIILFTNVLLFTAIKYYRWTKKIPLISPAVFLLLIVLPLIYGSGKISDYTETDKKVRIGLIQPDFNPHKKWDAGSFDEQLDIYLNLSQNAVDDGADLIVWPEAALPGYLLVKYTKQVQKIKEFIDSGNVFLMTGMPDATYYFDRAKAPEDAKPIKNSETVYTSYNSILLFSPGSEDIQKYGKIKLVPFGEKVPLADHIPFLGDLIKWNVGITGWNTGTDTVVFHLTNKRFSTGVSEVFAGGLVCIESIYPDFCASFVQKGAEILVVVTNDSWYGNSSGPYQHKEFAALRAVENRRSVVRAANGGISCLIDPLGRTVAGTSMFERDVLVVEAGLNDSLTFYTKYPLLIPLTCVLVVILLLIISIHDKLKIRFTKSNEKV
jgi:apolipoprotein N-acyltransferase